jgi:lipopolysaccharide transport system ATP-binding protein
MCDEALWLRSGRVVAHGTPETVVEQYLDDQGMETRQRTPADAPIRLTRMGTELRVNENRFGSLEMEITDVRFLDCRGRPLTKLQNGNALHVTIDYVAPLPLRAPIFGVTISRDDGLICCDTSTEAAGLSLPILHGHGRITLVIERLDLDRGQYYVDVGAYEANWTYAYDYHWHVYPLVIDAPEGQRSIVRPPYCWVIDEVPPPESDGSEMGMQEANTNGRGIS